MVGMKIISILFWMKILWITCVLLDWNPLDYNQHICLDDTLALSQGINYSLKNGYIAKRNPLD